MTDINTLTHTLKIKVNKSAPTIFPIIDCYVEYHIERCALVFKISFMRKWAWCVRNGSWLAPQAPHGFHKAASHTYGSSAALTNL